MISLKQTRLIFLHILFFSSQKFSLRVLLSSCLIFCHFQPYVVYKSLAYKIGCILVVWNESPHEVWLCLRCISSLKNAVQKQKSSLLSRKFYEIYQSRYFMAHKRMGASQKPTPEMFFKKKVLLRISLNSWKSTCIRCSVLIKLQSWDLHFYLKKYTLTQVFSFKFSETSKMTFFTEQFHETASNFRQLG